MLPVTFAESWARPSLNGCYSLKHSFIAPFTESSLSLMAGVPSHQGPPDERTGAARRPFLAWSCLVSCPPLYGHYSQTFSSSHDPFVNQGDTKVTMENLGLGFGLQSTTEPCSLSSLPGDQTDNRCGQPPFRRAPSPRAPDTW